MQKCLLVYFRMQYSAEIAPDVIKGFLILGSYVPKSGKIGIFRVWTDILIPLTLYLMFV